MLGGRQRGALAVGEGSVLVGSATSVLVGRVVSSSLIPWYKFFIFKNTE